MATSSAAAVPPLPSVSEWLSARTDEFLIELLTHHRDRFYALPDFLTAHAIAGMLYTASAWTLKEQLSTPMMLVMQSIAELEKTRERSEEPLTVAEISTFIATRLGHYQAPAPVAVITEALTQLRAQGLIYGDGSGENGHFTPADADPSRRIPVGVTLREIGDFTHSGIFQLLPPARSDAEVARQIAALSNAERQALLRLSYGSGRGKTTAFQAAEPQRYAAVRLAEVGLVVRDSETSVQITEQALHLILGKEPRPVICPTLSLPSTFHAPQGVEAALAGYAATAMATVQQLTVVMQALETESYPPLGGGGLGKRQVSRLVKHTGLSQQDTIRSGDFAYLAGLAAEGKAKFKPGDPLAELFAPTTQWDAFCELSTPEQWAVLVQAWLEGTTPLVEKFADASPALIAHPRYQHAQLAAYRRYLYLPLLTIPESEGVAQGEDYYELGSYLHPAVFLERILDPTTTATTGENSLDEEFLQAQALGLVVRLPQPGDAPPLIVPTPLLRVALTGSRSDLVAACRAALPEPVEEVIVQGDLTVIAPGPLTRAAQNFFTAIADVESTGAAMTFRITEASIRRGYAAGLTQEELLSRLTDCSLTDLPQALTYLIADAAKHTASARIGDATSYLRSEDPGVLSQVMSNRSLVSALKLRQLAPTVLIAEADLYTLQEAVEKAGIVLQQEDRRGHAVQPVDVGWRITRRRSARDGYVLGATQPETTGSDVEELVRQLRENASAVLDTSPGSHLVFPESLAQYEALDAALDALTHLRYEEQVVVLELRSASGEQSTRTARIASADHDRITIVELTTLKLVYLPLSSIYGVQC